MQNSIFPKLVDNGLSRIAGELMPMLEPAIRLITFPCHEDDLAIGSSRIGGVPDLPDNVIWPMWRNKPLAFLAQINLAECAHFQFASFLPKEGWLVFFYDVEQSTWGYDPNDKGSLAVLFIAKTQAPLKRRELPIEIPNDAFYNLCRVGMREIITAPPYYDSSLIEKLQLSPDELDAYLNLVDEIYSEGGVYHQFLGYPQPVQGDMQLECQLVSNGLYCGDPSGYNNPKALELSKGATEWKLLFQLDTDENTKMIWGDVGRLYFLLRENYFVEKKFGESWMVLQCS